MMRTMLEEARPSPSTATLGKVVVLCRLLLISQAVSAALGGRGINAEALAWSAGVRGATDELSEADVVLLFDDLVDRDAMAATMRLISTSPARFVVLTHRPEGAAWGGMLASGAVAVMPTESTLVEVDAALSLVRHGGSPVDEKKRDRLMREWFNWLSEDEALRERLAHLSAREREVLELLAAGHRVSDIVHDLDVAESTARSHIKAIRRKLGVGSQLAAVAALHRLGDGLPSPVDRRTPLLPSPRKGS